MGKNPVLICYRDNVGPNGNSEQVEIRLKLRKCNSLLNTKCLQELEAHATSTQALKRVGTIIPFRIKHGIGRRQLSRVVVVTDNNINAMISRILHFQPVLNATIQ